MKRSLTFTILGAPQSKANSRKIVTIAGHAASIKSDKARSYVAHALRQLMTQMGKQPPLEGPVVVTITIYYPDRRQDLDPSLILDVMQAQRDKRTKLLLWPGVYVNDRQVHQMHLFRAVDKLNPRSEIQVTEL